MSACTCSSGTVGASVGTVYARAEDSLSASQTHVPAGRDGSTPGIAEALISSAVLISCAKSNRSSAARRGRVPVQKSRAIVGTAPCRYICQSGGARRHKSLPTTACICGRLSQCPTSAGLDCHWALECSVPRSWVAPLRPNPPFDLPSLMSALLPNPNSEMWWLSGG